MKLFILMIGLVIIGRANQKAQGWCEVGATTLTIAGIPASSLVQGSFPLCLVSVNIHGGGTATIYADNNSPPTPLTNPFHGSAAGIWGFYAANGEYDVTLCSDTIQNGTCNGPVPAFTIYDILLNTGSGGGGGGAVSSVSSGTPALTINPSTGAVVVQQTAAVTVTFSTSPTFNLALGDLQVLTLTGDATSPIFQNASPNVSYRIKICQDTLGSHQFVWPSGITGPMIVGTEAGHCSLQRFTSTGASNLSAEAPGIVNQ
jgi:hypothetical protein